jgi:hypothetical protein
MKGNECRNRETKSRKSERKPEKVKQLPKKGSKAKKVERDPNRWKQSQKNKTKAKKGY